MSNDVDAERVHAPTNASFAREWSWAVFSTTATAAALAILAVIDKITNLRVPIVGDLLDVMDNVASNLGVIISIATVFLAAGAITWRGRRSDNRALNVRRPVLWGAAAGLLVAGLFTTANWMIRPTVDEHSEQKSYSTAKGREQRGVIPIPNSASPSTAPYDGRIGESAAPTSTNDTEKSKPAPLPTPSEEEQLINSGRLTIPTNQAANLDSKIVNDWQVGAGDWHWRDGTTRYNIGYSSGGIGVDGGSAKVALLGAAGNWSSATCDSATYGNGDLESTAIDPRHGFCYITTAGNRALLTVQARSPESITFTVQVWRG